MQGMLRTTIAEGGRKIGPSHGTYLQRCCDLNSNSSLFWPPPIHTPPLSTLLQAHPASLPPIPPPPPPRLPSAGVRAPVDPVVVPVTSTSPTTPTTTTAIPTTLTTSSTLTSSSSSSTSSTTTLTRISAEASLQPEPAPLNYSTTSLKTRTSCEVTESVFASGGYNTPPASSPFLAASPYDLITKDYHQSIAFSQANSIFVQSHTGFVSGTSSISKKTETCIGRWEHTLEPLHIQVPPFQPLTNLTVKTEGISCGSSRSSSKFDDLTPQSINYSVHHNQLQTNATTPAPTAAPAGCNNSGGLVTTMTTSSPSMTCVPSSNDLTNGCSRTIPISWSASSTTSSSAASNNNNNNHSNTIPSSTSSLLGVSGLGRGTGGGLSSSYSPENHSTSQQQQQQQHRHQQHHAASSSSSSTSSSSLTLLQIKREPCQVSEVTTSNNLGHQQHQSSSSSSHHSQSHHRSTSASLTAVVKIESSSPKSTVMDSHQNISASQNTAGAIPVGIAVARQRLQEHTTVTHQPKESNRFGIGIADIGGATSSVSSQNMFFAGTNSTMIPFNSDALVGAPNVQNAVRTPPTFWQYPTPVPVESMFPMPIPPVGFQLVRDPSTGQFLFLPATTATIEPFQPAVVWPTYPQPGTAIQSPHLLLPPIAQSLQPPPLAPLQLLGSDYLATASTTLHQHTQTHSTRFVALTSDAKRKQVSGSAIPLPIPHHAVIKIEDCSGGTTTTNGASTAHHHHHQSAAIYGDDKNASMHATAATITTAVQTNDVGGNLPTQLYYHQPSAGLIQIAPPPSHHSQTTSIQECSRSITAGNVTGSSPPTPSLPPPPPTLIVSQSLPTSSPKITTCLQSPISEQIAPENLEAATSCVPEVQDANIQTDTPVMSEDDNTIGADDIPLQIASQAAEFRDGIHSTSLVQQHHHHHQLQQPPSTSMSPLCHNISNNVEESIESPDASNHYHHQHHPHHHHHHQKDEENLSNKTDSGFDSNAAVSSTNSLEESSPFITTDQWNGNCCNNVNMMVQVENDREISTPNNVSSEMSCENEQEYREVVPKVTSTPMDLSGLELLSNISIEAIEKKVAFIKQEPTEEKKIPMINSLAEEVLEHKENKMIEMPTEKFVNQHDQLGGLNLLCALAEQRIQEEVGKRHRKRSSSSSESHGSKRKKHKHSKSSKKSRHDKEKKEKKRYRKEQEDDNNCKQEELTIATDGLDQDIKETFKRVKAKYTKCACQDDKANCCKEKCGWPTPEELMLAMETDMRLRLADITRQCQEKKRELEEMNPILQQRKQQQSISDGESTTPLSSKCSIRSYNLEKQLNTISCTSFNYNNSPIPSEIQNVGMGEIMKNSSDTESSSKFEDIETCSSSSSKRKAVIPKKQDDSNTETIVAKKPKSLVGYILASKKRSSTESVKEKNDNAENTGFLTDETTVFSESSSRPGILTPLKIESEIKEEPEEDNDSKIAMVQFSLAAASKTAAAGTALAGTVPSEGAVTLFSEKKYHRKSSKHHSKHKKSKNSKDRKLREIEKRKIKIDSSCILSSEDLDKGKTRVLTAMAGLFYAGTLSPVQPPDIYAVTLDGERNNKPHIMSREEVLRDAILEKSPNTIDEIPAGTRICAYWSQQYRCLYPGTVAVPGTPDTINDKKFVCVEFDDGDSGRIAIEDIRFLLSDYPIVEYDPNPLLSLGKRKRRTSQNIVESTSQQKSSEVSVVLPSTSSNYFGIIEDKNSKPKYNMSAVEKDDYNKERRKLKKMKKDRHKKLELEGIGIVASTGGGGGDEDVVGVEGEVGVGGGFGVGGGEKKHKKKHKCSEEFCKHRKHKKRKKHKKHHRHENNFQNVADSSQDGDFSQNGSTPLVGDSSTSPNEEDIADETNYSITNMMPKKVDADEETTVIFDPSAKEEDTMMEEEIASSTTESSGSIYVPRKKKERQNSADNHSKIAAFLPARQLWAWAGKGHKRSVKGRAKKQFYKSIQRGKETITVGDSAVFLSTGRPDRPYIGKIESMWETSSSNKVVRVRWFYHPEETIGCPKLRYPGALFESPHADENDVQTISHKCEVLPLDDYTKKFGPDLKQYENIYDNNDTYYSAGYYDPTIQSLKLQPDIPTVLTPENSPTTTTATTWSPTTTTTTTTSTTYEK